MLEHGTMVPKSEHANAHSEIGFVFRLVQQSMGPSLVNDFAYMVSSSCLIKKMDCSVFFADGVFTSPESPLLLPQMTPSSSSPDSTQSRP